MMTSLLPNMKAALCRLASRLYADRSGNIFIMMGFAIFPLMFAIGFGIDYSRAEKLETQLNAAADAAALAAVDPSMISQSNTVAAAAATAMFNAQAANLPGLASVTLGTPVFAAVATGSLGNPRTITLSYTGTSKNVFSGILGMATLPVSGTATASASLPPSINFFIALDTSPSMLLPTTATGISNLRAGAYSVYYKTGCDFACHSTNMQTWNSGVFVSDTKGNAIWTSPDGTTFYRVTCATSKVNASLSDSSFNALGTNVTVTSSSSSSTGISSICSTSTTPPSNSIALKYLPTGKADKTANYVTLSVNYPDTWWLAQNYDVVNPGQSQITLRTDAEGAAAQSVINYARALEVQYADATVPPVYKMQFYTFNLGNPVPLTTTPFGTMTDVKTSQSTPFPDMGANAPNMPAMLYWTVAGVSTLTNNADTSFTNMLTWMKSTGLPTSAGTGTPTNPQSVLMIITDGAQDSTADGMGTINATNVTQCNAIKLMGTRIAILYTVYDPSTISGTSNSTFNNFASNTIPTILTQLQACASKNTDGSYLLQTVTTDQDLSAAMNSLFAMSVQTARLVQ